MQIIFLVIVDLAVWSKKYKKPIKYIYLNKSVQFIWLNDLIYLLSGLPLMSKFFRQVIPSNRAGKGSFVLASMLGNTGFIGLAIVPNFVEQHYWSWIVLYGVTHNLLGSYGLGAVVANYFSCSSTNKKRALRLWDLLKIPSLWAFALGYLTRNILLPDSVESIARYGIFLVVPSAFLLIGMQLGKLRGIKSLKVAIVPTSLKILILPGLAAIALTILGIKGDGRLALVLMSSMPTAFANVILAEEYNLDRQIAAGSILLSTVTLPFVFPLWLACLS